jgi:hypothetical protein
LLAHGGAAPFTLAPLARHFDPTAVGERDLLRAKAPFAVCGLLALSTLVALHGPPTGPFGLVCFAAALALPHRTQIVSAAA